ncbi:MAG: inositol monophosphatase [Clostridiales bacterium]|nr:inositol monophosphatase [Clostridiales bacterium]
MQEELAAVIAAATAGADVIRAADSDRKVTRSKSSSIDLVTETDIAAGVAVWEAIVKRDSQARLVIEEEEVYGLASARRGSLDDDEVWCVDPLDGTTSFVHGFPAYSVSVALLRRGTPVAGAVVNVPSAEIVAAAAGIGATRNGAPIQCSAAGALGESLLITGFPYDRGAPLDRQLAILGAFLRVPVHGIRRTGSAAIDCTHVAGGRADGYWEFGLKPWDMAAGVIICEEAGVHVTGINGEPWSVASTGIIAANPSLHKRMTAVILGG